MFILFILSAFLNINCEFDVHDLFYNKIKNEKRYFFEQIKSLAKNKDDLKIIMDLNFIAFLESRVKNISEKEDHNLEINYFNALKEIKKDFEKIFSSQFKNLKNYIPENEEKDIKYKLKELIKNKLEDYFNYFSLNKMKDEKNFKAARFKFLLKDNLKAIADFIFINNFKNEIKSKSFKFCLKENKFDFYDSHYEHMLIRKFINKEDYLNTLKEIPSNSQKYISLIFKDLKNVGIELSENEENDIRSKINELIKRKVERNLIEFSKKD